ncbi:F0F1 ATP synthase subunit A, partial [Cognatishimia sp.]|nr:F0F1 ATP synthase subunit A [Cognatishimia sp.]
MDQFIVKPLFGGDHIGMFTITNVTLWMALAVVAVIAMMVFGTSSRKIVPGRSQSVAELAYGFIYKMVEDVAGKDAVKFFPYIMTLFMFIVFANFLGLIPMSFTTTSHFAVTVVLALLVFVTVTVVGFVKNGLGFLGLFWVSSAPLPLRPILAIIELISYFVRPVSHSIRLAG